VGAALGEAENAGKEQQKGKQGEQYVLQAEIDSKPDGADDEGEDCECGAEGCFNAADEGNPRTDALGFACP